MAWQLSEYSLLLLISTAVSLFSSLHIWIYRWRSQRIPGAKAAAALLFMCAQWTLAYAMEIGSRDPGAMVFWAKFSYLGIVSVPIMWLVFMIQYTGRDSWLAGWRRFAIGAIPALTLLAVFTNDLHGLIWSSVVVSQSGEGLDVQHGGWFWVHTAYSYLLLLAVTTVVAELLLRARRYYKWQASALLFVATLPWLSNAFYILGGVSIFPFDTTPLAFSIVSVALAWSLSGLRTGDIMSFASSTAVHIMSDGLLILDAQQHVVFLNPTAEELVGMQAVKAIGLPVEQIWPSWKELQIGPGESGGSGKDLLIGKNGVERAYDVRVSDQFDWRARLVGRVVAIRDVTERKRVEERRERFIQDLAFLSRTATQFVELYSENEVYHFIGEELEKQVKGSVVIVNSFDSSTSQLVTRAILGLGSEFQTLSKLLGMELVGSAHTADEIATRALRSCKLTKVEDGIYGLTFGRIPRPICRTADALMKIKEIYSVGFARQGQLFGSIVIVLREGCLELDREIIETFANQASVAVQRMRAEEALRESEERFRRLAENAQDVIFRYELGKQRCSYVSPAIAGLGYTAEEIYGIQGLPVDLIHPDDLHLLEELALGVQAAGHFEMRCIHKDGSTVWTELRAVTISDESGAMIAVEGIVRDITKRKQLEEQLMQAQRLETAGRIAGQVAHDFNNLLAPLTAYPDLIKLQVPDDPAVAKFCDAMLETAERMGAINEDMMALGRRGHFDEQAIDMNGLVSQLAEGAAGAAEGLPLKLHLATCGVVVRGSSAQLLRVITNLVSNAREAAGPAGTVSISTERVRLSKPAGRLNNVPAGAYVVVQVADNGPGIPSDILDRVFDPFFTTKAREKRQGCGLGLSIVQGIVQDHHGYVDIETEVGVGTRFRVYLPQSIEPAALAPAQEVSGGNETVLVVDDDPVQREVTVRLLSRLGYQVSSVCSGEEAVGWMERKSADLMILDMMMPGGIDGAETYHRVLGIAPGQRAIILSGFSASDRVEWAQTLGAGGYLRKPVTMERLARAVRQELDRVA